VRRRILSGPLLRHTWLTATRKRQESRPGTNERKPDSAVLRSHGSVQVSAGNSNHPYRSFHGKPGVGRFHMGADDVGLRKHPGLIRFLNADTRFPGNRRPGEKAQRNQVSHRVFHHL